MQTPEKERLVTFKLEWWTDDIFIILLQLEVQSVPKYGPISAGQMQELPYWAVKR
jgi:hypothetical protein